MAVVSGSQPSAALVSTGLSVATVALSVAGAAADAVPVAKQILNSAAHICSAAERIQKKHEAMYLLVEKADVYATQIDQAVADCNVDASLQRRLGRLYSVFVKIKALVNDQVDGKNPALVRVWRNVITKPNRAEALVAELDREIELFHILTGIQLSADVKYDGQFRRLRDCDIEKLDVICKRETNEGIVVWASARVKRELMVIRYVESQPNAKMETMTTLNGSSPWQLSGSYHDYLENVKKVSTVRGSHPNIVQLYGRHFQGPEAVFRAGQLPLNDYLDSLNLKERTEEDAAVKYLRLVHKILDASAHLSDLHGLEWVGEEAIVDENGEPCIGLFDDIVQAEPDLSPSSLPSIYYDIFLWFNFRFSNETGVVEQVHDSSLHAIITEYLRDGNDTDRLQRVWDIIRQVQLHVEYDKCTFPIVSGNLSLSEEMIARARLYFETHIEEDTFFASEVSFIRSVLAGGSANISSRVCFSIWREDGDHYEIEVVACTHDDSHVQYHQFWIHFPAGCPLLADIARAVGLPDDFEQLSDAEEVHIYPQQKKWGVCHLSSGPEEGSSEEYETADEGEAYETEECY